METIITTTISILVSVILTLVGIKYSSRFHIKKEGKAKEKYVVVEKISHGTIAGFIDSARVALTKSSLDNAMGFMDVSLTRHPENIVVDRYAFTHSFIHNMFAPGKIILNKKKNGKKIRLAIYLMATSYQVKSLIQSPSISYQIKSEKKSINV